MRRTVICATWALLTGATLSHAVLADTVDANCEVRKDGDKQKGKSGPCTYSQRQGYIDIDLKNGDVLKLSPSGGTNQYKDQHHNRVHRVASSSREAEFKWEGGKHVIVTFSGNYYGDGNHNKSYDNSNNNGYGAGAGGYAAGRDRDDYQRGYRDGQAGRYDQQSHTQAYKDGVRAGEDDSRNGRGNGNAYGNGNGNGNGNGGNHHGGYTIKEIGNGMFEVMWNNGCIADYTRNGNNDGYTNCNDEMRRKSDDIARQRAR